ncbi:MAG TPA: DUF1326 domain-containing protein [Blastocatellia bacterium]|nr:DUF1326 domain-containing protein [Blastocatellia bacterium]
MRKTLHAALVALLALAGGGPAAAAAKPAPSWSFNATIIEACSCPMFCQCYFATKPAGHSGRHDGMEEHYCRFNMAYRVNKGNYGGVSLDGAKFWLAGDLGGDFSQGKTDWVEVTFDPAVTKEQRDGIAAVLLGHVYPVKWNSVTVAKDAPLQWSASKDRAEARLDNGKAGEIVLRRNPGMTDDPVVIKNLRYFGAPRNEGFVLMPNEVEAYRVGNKAFEFKGTNGFMITLDITSKDVKSS